MRKIQITFGVIERTMYGAKIPNTLPIPFVMPLNVPAYTGLKSIGFNITPTVIIPSAPIDIMNSVTTSNSLQPAYDAAITKNAGTIEAVSIE